MEEHGRYTGLFEEESEADTEELFSEGSETEKETMEPPALEDGLTIKYNGEVKRIPLSQATILAQKGMNYDKVLKERDALKNSEELNELAQWGQITGMSAKKFAAFLKERRAEAELSGEVQKVLGEYPDLPEKAARELAGFRRGMGDKPDPLAPWKRLIDEFPEAAEGEPDPEMAEAIVDGMDPVEAMLRKKLRQLEEQAKKTNFLSEVREKNRENRGRALASPADTAGDGGSDPFLKGLGF